MQKYSTSGHLNFFQFMSLSCELQQRKMGMAPMPAHGVVGHGPVGVAHGGKAGKAGKGGKGKDKKSKGGKGGKDKKSKGGKKGKGGNGAEIAGEVLSSAAECATS